MRGIKITRLRVANIQQVRKKGLDYHGNQRLIIVADATLPIPKETALR